MHVRTKMHTLKQNARFRARTWESPQVSLRGQSQHLIIKMHRHPHVRTHTYTHTHSDSCLGCLMHSQALVAHFLNKHFIGVFPSSACPALELPLPPPPPPPPHNHPAVTVQNFCSSLHTMIQYNGSNDVAVTYMWKKKMFFFKAVETFKCELHLGIFRKKKRIMHLYQINFGVTESVIQYIN